MLFFRKAQKILTSIFVLLYANIQIIKIIEIYFQNRKTEMENTKKENSNGECADFGITKTFPKYNGDMQTLQTVLDESQVGTIYVRTGPMSSGKTSQLITKCIELELQRLPCIIIRSTIDNRSLSGKVQSATGQQKECHCCDNLMESRSLIDYIKDNIQVIFIDEAQFFGPDLVEFCELMAHTYNKSVWVYGLNGDSDRKKFGHIADLMPIWTDHKSLYGYCSTCKIGRKGVYTRAIVKKTGQVKTGNQGLHYITECSRCYNKEFRRQRN